MRNTPTEIIDERNRKVAPTSAYGRRFLELFTASRVVGDTAGSRLAWVTKFIAENPDQWNDATIAAHANCLQALSGQAMPSNLLGGIKLPPPLAADDVRETHRLLLQTLKAAVGAEFLEKVPINMEGLSVALVRVTQKGQKPAGWSLTYSSTTPSTAVMRAVLDLVMTAGDRLVACRLCGNPIYAVKKQQFCNAVEAQTFRNAKRPEKGKTKRSRHDTKTRPR
jgi:hypothetical protein